jgi:hypothetical protein
MRSFSSAFLVASILLCSVTAHAAPNVTPSAEPVIVSNYLHDDSGLISCGKIIEQDAEGVGRTQWGNFIGGYLTASNLLRGRQTPTLDIASAYAWIVHYCRDRPLEMAVDAFSSLDRELGPGRWPVIRDSWKSPRKQEKQ